jgi:hypothetical protein
MAQQISPQKFDDGEGGYWAGDRHFNKDGVDVTAQDLKNLEENGIRPGPGPDPQPSPTPDNEPDPKEFAPFPPS